MNKFIKKNLREALELVEDKHPYRYDRESIVQVLKDLAYKHGNPVPTRELDRGLNAIVFTTTNPDVVMRVEEIQEGEEMKSMNEYIMANPKIQNTGGVTRIYDIGSYDVNGKNYLVSWKEYVDDICEHFLYEKYEENEEYLEKVLDALDIALDRFKPSKETLDTLKNCKETSRLYAAILAGLPTEDLSVDTNLGVNDEGYIVAYDC